MRERFSSIWCSIFCLLIACAFSRGSAAESGGITKVDASTIQASDTMADNLRRLIGKDVAISLGYAPGLLAGVVLAVSEKYVHVRRTLDRSQFDVILEVDQINTLSVVVQ